MARYEEIKNIRNHALLAIKLEAAEGCLENDPAAAVLEMSEAMELMLRQLCARHAGTEYDDNYERITELHERGILDEDLRNGLHSFRVIADDVRLDGYEVEDYEAGTCFEDMLRLAEIFTSAPEKH